MEAMPTFIVAFNVCAATFPRFASAVGAVWLGARVLYQLGYEKKGPKGRGGPSTLSSVGLLTLVFPDVGGLLMGDCWGRVWIVRRVYCTLVVGIERRGFHRCVQVDVFSNSRYPMRLRRL